MRFLGRLSSDFGPQRLLNVAHLLISGSDGGCFVLGNDQLAMAEPFNGYVDAGAKVTGHGKTHGQQQIITGDHQHTIRLPIIAK